MDKPRKDGLCLLFRFGFVGVVEDVAAASRSACSCCLFSSSSRITTWCLKKFDALVGSSKRDDTLLRSLVDAIWFTLSKQDVFVMM